MRKLLTKLPLFVRVTLAFAGTLAVGAAVIAAIGLRDNLARADGGRSSCNVYLICEMEE